MSLLFTPLRLRELTLPNRVWVSPMCQYSSTDGHPSDWHLVHLGARAVGGAGLVLAEATAVSPRGRISPQDAGLWSSAHARDYRRITDFVRAAGSVPGVQLGHAGRKASTYRPWAPARGSVPVADGGWTTVGPSAVAFDGYAEPVEMTRADLDTVVGDFARAAELARQGGFEVLELHGAHGYLLHQFASPLSNRRSDGYGGSFAGRVRLALEVTEAVRAVWPAELPLLYRVSGTDWVDGGWDLSDTVALARLLGERGVDLVDVSSGGNLAHATIPVGPGYQVALAARVRRESGLPTAAVGLITEARQAEEILTAGAADAVLLARAVLRDPHWPLRAAAELGDDVAWPAQYQRAKLSAAWRDAGAR